MDLSVIIVNYRTYQKTKDTIDSVIDTIHNLDYEIFVVDNASCDGSLEQLQYDFKKIKNINFIKNSANKGFANANNLAIKNTKGKFTLLLNSDVIVDDHTIENTLDYIKQHKNTKAVGCRVLLPDGSLDKACRRSFPTPAVSFYRLTNLSKIFPKSKRFNRYNLSYLDEEGIYPVDCIVGAYMLIDSKTLYECGSLDESYFMYGEDIELCYQIKQLGYNVIYYGKSTVTHFKGASGKNKRLLYEFHKSMEIFYNKHYKNKNNFVTNTFIYCGIWLLYYLKLIKYYL